MIKFAGLGRLAAATILLSGIALGSVNAQEVSEDQIKAARAAINALGITNQFDNILPNLAEQLKSTMIQANPNFGDAINSTVDATALALAPRRADLEREAAVTYAKAFSADELKAIADFYNSPAGKKLLKDGPLATRELYKAADIWSQGISRDLAKQSNDALQKVVKQPVAVPDAGAAAAQPAPKQ
ncbi:DUF2059 domain-containing protein [Rhizobium sp. P40RR-XXII]|uniref:DUF2059 domain-containing protein n=1 Tax=unclassified Rhizobium TaxID=2613769 RepID=UPI0014577D27|nr:MULTISPECIES: DUF2059 domain-containing protein [unclassified Rhizobium]NLR83323.1 DUF2059 domain-containing protein [Rhizobium sp. P28RR-XV]NLS15743.1 DUF2059 domain-containing protein [Rhizobium sp. P40RR-XXII]